MPHFNKFKKVLDIQFVKLAALGLYKTNVSKDDLWDTYLSSFPEGTNLLFRERTEYDCNCCKQFIRACGNTVAIVDNKLVSIWDVQVDSFFQEVADTMSTFVKSQFIIDILLHSEDHFGTDFNHQELESGEIITWNHFYFSLPSVYIKAGAEIGGLLSTRRSSQGVLKRGLTEITLDSAETVIDLIEQNSLYRGEEHLAAVETFISQKREFDVLENKEEKDNFCWQRATTPGIRNTVIGTLLCDISEGVDLTQAVKKFESKVAPENYKRPTALITASMIKKAQEKVGELGIEASLLRRYAKMDDITINNVLFADRTARKTMNVFDELSKEVEVNNKSLSKVEEINIEDFINVILPKVESVEVLFENKHSNNLVSLIAPTEVEAPAILKWGNNFSWTYNGAVTDSIKERVKKAGGNVNGVLRISASWFNFDDLDLHVKEPNGNHIEFPNKGRVHLSSGKLDVDMNVSNNDSRTPVENVVYTEKEKIQEGIHKVWMHNYTHREGVDVGFVVEVEYDGEIHTFSYTKEVQKSEKVVVAEFTFSKENGIKFINSLPSSTASKEIWNVATHRFQPVSIVLNSPNHWDGENTGNKHYFFMIENCKNDNPARGFFNEFLKGDLQEHRKVFEVLGSKMKTKVADNQLSGLGFSSTKRASLLCKVSGSFTRTLKINF